MRLTVNGKAQNYEDDPDMPLLWYLRDDLRLTGTRFGCGAGLCGACTVHVNGQAVRSCQTRMGTLESKTVLTIDALGEGGKLHPVVGLWPVALADDLEAQLHAGVRKVLQWTARHAIVEVEFPFLRFHGRLIDPFFNANTPEELDEARALIESRCTQ